jgi:hypothetical protein
MILMIARIIPGSVQSVGAKSMSKTQTLLMEPKGDMTIYFIVEMCREARLPPPMIKLDNNLASPKINSASYYPKICPSTCNFK